MSQRLVVELLGSLLNAKLFELSAGVGKEAALQNATAVQSTAVLVCLDANVQSIKDHLF